MAKSVKIVRNFKAPETEGVHYRLVCMTGKNKGLTYYLLENRVVLGRGDKTDIQVLDVKSSREHAELKKVGKHFVVTDLGSQNGIIVNDLKVTQHELHSNDNLIIGHTVFKYNVVTVKPPTELVELDEDDDDEDFDEFVEETFEDSKKKAPDNKKKLILYALVALVFAFVFLSGDESESEPRPKKQSLTEDTDSFSQYARDEDEANDKDLETKIGAIVHRGLREYREGNYYRAIAEFNRALILKPRHGQASFYLQKTKQKINSEIENVFLKAKRETESLKYREAITSYCTVIRILRDSNSDSRVTEAKVKINELEEKIGYYKGEVKCIEE